MNSASITPPQWSHTMVKYDKARQYLARTIVKRQCELIRIDAMSHGSGVEALAAIVGTGCAGFPLQKMALFVSTPSGRGKGAEKCGIGLVQPVHPERVGQPARAIVTPFVRRHQRRLKGAGPSDQDAQRKPSKSHAAEGRTTQGNDARVSRMVGQ
jgi:hypothetical protein